LPNDVRDAQYDRVDGEADEIPEGLVQDADEDAAHNLRRHNFMKSVLQTKMAKKRKQAKLVRLEKLVRQPPAPYRAPRARNLVEVEPQIELPRERLELDDDVGNHEERRPQPSEPILIPKLRIQFADFPYLHSSID